MKFVDFFPNTLEYPNPTLTMLECGLLHEYVSSKFLDGWINYVNIISARLITRYYDHTRNAQLLDDFNNGKVDSVHTELGMFDDDVCLLCQDDAGLYWMFYYDFDVSGCMIGRFWTDDYTKEQVTEMFIEYANDLSMELSDSYAMPYNDPEDDTAKNKGGIPSREINTKYIHGWLSFL